MINFKKAGSSKKILVFLHGWGGSWQSWAPIINRLQTTNYRLQIYALDLPGFGQSPLTRPYRLEDYVADLASFFAKEKIKKPVLIGHSFGGQIAIKFAVEKGELLSKLVLVDVAGVRRNDKQIKLDIALARWGKGIITRTPLAFLYPVLRPIYYRLRGITNSDYYHLPINSPLQKTLSRIMREDLTAEFKKIKVPALIFWGEKDPPELTPISMAKTLNEQIKYSKLVVVPGAGHFSYLDDQKLFCNALMKFI